MIPDDEPHDDLPEDDTDDLPMDEPTGVFYGRGPDQPAEEGGQLRDPNEEGALDDDDEEDDEDEDDDRLPGSEYPIFPA